MSEKQKARLEPVMIVTIINRTKRPELPRDTLEHGLLFALEFRAWHRVTARGEGAFQLQLKSSVIETVPGVDDPLSVQRSTHFH